MKRNIKIKKVKIKIKKIDHIVLGGLRIKTFSISFKCNPRDPLIGIT